MEQHNGEVSPVRTTGATFLIARGGIPFLGAMARLHNCSPKSRKLAYQHISSELDEGEKKVTVHSGSVNNEDGCKRRTVATLSNGCDCCVVSHVRPRCIHEEWTLVPRRYRWPDDDAGGLPEAETFAPTMPTKRSRSSWRGRPMATRNMKIRWEGGAVFVAG
uniref:Uncharacterized protein n=1 Tax=Oryza rufipogon TaxID=4529 RepID=A0A0E0RCK3_ORYRU